MLNRMDGWAREGRPFSLNAAYKVATKDIIQAYALGNGQKCLKMEDLNAPFFDILNTERLSHISVHFYWVPTLMAKLPPWLLVVLKPSIEAFIRFVEVNVLISFSTNYELSFEHRN